MLLHRRFEDQTTTRSTNSQRADKLKVERPCSLKIRQWNFDYTETLKGCLIAPAGTWFLAVKKTKAVSWTWSHLTQVLWKFNNTTKTLRIFPKNKPWITKELKQYLSEKKIVFLQRNSQNVRDFEKNLEWRRGRQSWTTNKQTRKRPWARLQVARAFSQTKLAHPFLSIFVCPVYLTFSAILSTHPPPPPPHQPPTYLQPSSSDYLFCLHWPFACMSLIPSLPFATSSLLCGLLYTWSDPARDQLVETLSWWRIKRKRNSFQTTVKTEEDNARADSALQFWVTSCRGEGKLSSAKMGMIALPREQRPRVQGRLIVQQPNPFNQGKWLLVTILLQLQSFEMKSTAKGGSGPQRTQRPPCSQVGANHIILSGFWLLVIPTKSECSWLCSIA